ncbi:hypothetical protein P308_11585 [Pseudomonas piscis]|nr:hypothetical protein P308_11585 [Pseudomonas piscis]
MLLRPEAPATHLETLAIQVIGQATLDPEVELIVQRQGIQEAGAQLLRLQQCLAWVGPKDLQSQLGEFTVAPGLGLLVAITAGNVEEHCLGPSRQQLASGFLEQRGGFRDQAARASGLVGEGPHLADDFTATGLLDEGVLAPQGRDYDLFSTRFDEASSGTGPPGCAGWRLVRR